MRKSRQMGGYHAPQGGTFLQIHYHNRPGGVATVMERYARAFAKACRRSPHAELVVCSAADRAAFAVDVIDVKDCDYKTFHGRPSFDAARRRIAAALASVLDNNELPRPVFVVGHNMNLGKNCALSSAFAETAGRRLRAADDIRFFSIVHDFAEEGRTDLLSGIMAVERLGIDIWNDLYPRVANVHFVTPGRRNHALLQEAGYSASILENPVEKINKDAAGRQSLRRRRAALCAIATSDNVALKLNRPIVLYPARVIARKNSVEAVLVAHVIFKSNLLLGAPGVSKEDERLYSCLKKICRRHKVPVVFDAGRIVKNESFGALYRLADVCLTTSLAEGFGYAIHESSLHGIAIIGRLPQGISSSDRGAVARANLYEALYVPSAWVKVNALKKNYLRRLEKIWVQCTTTPSYDDFSESFDAAFIKNHGIDFGCLTAAMQLDILNYCLGSTQAALEWKQAFPAQTARLQALFSAACGGSQKKPHPVSREYDFAMRFKRVFFGEHPALGSRTQPDPRAMLASFCALEYFRPLMTPQRLPRMQKAPAVFT